MSERRPQEESVPLQDAEVSWRPWRMGELRTPRETGQASGPSADETAFQRQAELRALRDKIMQEAREQGHREGFEAGHAEGHAQGLEEGLEKGLEKGLEEGREQAHQAFEREAREALAPLERLAEQFGEALARRDEEIGNELAELALATGRQLAGEALKARPKQVLEIIKALLHTEPGMNGKTRLWLHPRDYALVEEHLGQELAAAGWSLQPDDQVTRGGCRVTSASGELDATWESRWAAVKRQVHRRKSPPEPSDDADSSASPGAGA